MTTTNLTVATRRMLWFQLHDLILDRSLPVPAGLNLYAGNHIVALSFDSSGDIKRWAASLGLHQHDPDHQFGGATALYFGDLAGWSVHAHGPRDGAS